jgi:hypothetical protein
MTLETAVIGLLVALAALINYYLQERANTRRAEDLEKARMERAASADALARSRAETLAAKVESHANALALVIGENTQLTREAGQHAQAAYHEANSVNFKIADTNKVAGEASDKLSALIVNRTEGAMGPGEVVIVNPKAVPVVVTEPTKREGE